MRAWRPALRIARREALRHRGRSLLVIVMVALPVGGAVAAGVILRTQEVSAVEGLDRRLGAADALISPDNGPVRLAQSFNGDIFAEVGRRPGGPPTAGDVRAALGPDARVIAYLTGPVPVRTRAGVAMTEATEVDLRYPMTRGLFDVRTGRLPVAPGEVVVSPRLEERGFRIGGRLRVEGEPARTVVGVVTSPRQRDSGFLAGLPGEAGIRDDTALRQLLVGKPGGVSWEDVKALNRRGMTAVSRRVVEDPPPESALDPGIRASGGGSSASEAGVVALIVVVALIQIVLLASPAFAVGARHSRHTLALMAAGGAEPRDLRRSVLALGLVLGGAGTLAGVAAGIGAARIALPIAERSAPEPFGPFEVAPLDLLAISAVGLLSAVLAAALPARTAARQDVVAVLSGRRGEPSPGRRSPLAGVLLICLGTGAAVAGARMQNGGAVIALATLFSVAGMVLVIPVVIAGLARIGQRLPLAVRFAVRDAARNRSRTAPAVAAVAATVVGVTALCIASASDNTQRARTHTPVGPVGAAIVSATDGLPPEARTVVRRALPGATVRTLYGVPVETHLEFTGLSGDGAWMQSFGSSVLVANGHIARLGLGLSRAAARRADAALARSGAAVLDPGRPGAATTTVRVDGARATVPAAFVAEGPLEPHAQAVIAPALARRLGLTVHPTSLLATGAEIGADREQNLNEALTALGTDVGLVVERGPGDGDQTVVLLVLGAIGAVLMLGGTLTATFLALSDARSDLATLAAVGASPRARRLIAAAYAGSVGLIGAVLGAALGLIPGVAAAYSSTSASLEANGAPGLPEAIVDVPWLFIGLVVLALPLLAAVVVGIAARPRLPMVRRVG